MAGIRGFILTLVALFQPSTSATCFNFFSDQLMFQILIHFCKNAMEHRGRGWKNDLGTFDDSLVLVLLSSKQLIENKSEINLSRGKEKVEKCTVIYTHTNMTYT